MSRLTNPEFLRSLADDVGRGDRTRLRELADLLDRITPELLPVRSSAVCGCRHCRLADLLAALAPPTP